MQNGKVKFFNEEKGFGFITTNSGDVFVHKSALIAAGIDSLKPDQEVEFDVEPDKKNGKDKAANLKLL